MIILNRKHFLLLILTNVVRIYYIMESLIIVFLLYLIKWMNSKDLKFNLVYIILNLIIICPCVVMVGIITIWFVIVLKIILLHWTILNMLLNLHYHYQRIIIINSLITVIKISKIIVNSRLIQ